MRRDIAIYLACLAVPFFVYYRGVGFRWATCAYITGVMAAVAFLGTASFVEPTPLKYLMDRLGFAVGIPFLGVFLAHWARKSQS